MLSTVPKGEILRPQTKRRQSGLVGDGAQRENRPWWFFRHLCAEKMVALPDFTQFRFILRWQAFHRIGDTAAGKGQAVLWIRRAGVVGIAEFVQRLVQQDPGVISRKRTSRAVRAMHSRSQADNQQIGGGVAERRDRQCVVARFAGTNFIEKNRQAGAGAAGRVKRCSHARTGQVNLRCCRGRLP